MGRTDEDIVVVRRLDSTIGSTVGRPMPPFAAPSTITVGPSSIGSSAPFAGCAVSGATGVAGNAIGVSWSGESGPGSTHETANALAVPLVESAAGSTEAASGPAENATAPARLIHSNTRRRVGNAAMRREGLLLLLLLLR
jgi:hypothetical protein